MPKHCRMPGHMQAMNHWFWKVVRLAVIHHVSRAFRHFSYGYPKYSCMPCSCYPKQRLQPTQRFTCPPKLAGAFVVIFPLRKGEVTGRDACQTVMPHSRLKPQQDLTKLAPEMGIACQKTCLRQRGCWRTSGSADQRVFLPLVLKLPDLQRQALCLQACPDVG